MTLSELFQSITNAIREKTGKTDKIEHIKIPDEINSMITVETMLQKAITEINTNVTVIPAYAFYKQTNLVSINMPNITSISDYAFNGCTALESITLPDSVTQLGIGIFVGCNKLNSINIPEGIKSIPQQCFSGCSKLVSINIPDSVSTLGYMCFNESGVTRIDCNNVISIDGQSFRQASATGKGLNALIIRTNKVCTLLNKNAFTATPVATGTGYIYVPDDLVEDYKSATNWSVYADQIKGLSELEE